MRVHDGETTILDAAFDAATVKLTFKSDKFRHMQSSIVMLRLKALERL